MSDSNFQLFTSTRYDPLLLSIPLNTEAWEPSTTAPPPTDGSPFYMLPYHRDRMLQAAERFNWPLAVLAVRGPSGFASILQKLNESIDIISSTPLRIRILLFQNGTVTIETSPTPPVELENLFPSRLPHPQSAQPKMDISPLTGGVLTSSSIHGDPPLTDPFYVSPDTVPTPPSNYTAYKTTSRDMYNTARDNVGIKDMAERREVLLVSTKECEIMEGSLTTPFFWRDGKWVTPKTESGGQIGTTRRWALEKGLCIEGAIKLDSLVEGEECYISNGVRGFQWSKVKLS